MKDEALRLALEALGHFEKAGLATLKTIDAITAIKQALEQEKALQALHDENERLGLYKDAYGQPEPEPEPVAWLYESVCGKDFATRCDPPSYAKNIRPLYTSPPKRKPLTDEQIKDALVSVDAETKRLPSGFRDFVRIIEAAHGIKGKA